VIVGTRRSAASSWRVSSELEDKGKSRMTTQSFYEFRLPEGNASIQIGAKAKLGDDGSIYIIDNSENVVAAYAPGQWLSMTSKHIPTVTVGNSGCAGWSQIKVSDLKVTS
jgi:hypothetical protein